MGSDGEYVRGPELLDDSGVFTLDRTGIYRVAIEGRDSNSTAFDYRFLLSRVSDGEAALTVGEAVTGRLAGPGDSVAYAFDLAADAWLMFDGLAGAADLDWTFDLNSVVLGKSVSVRVGRGVRRVIKNKQKK